MSRYYITQTAVHCIANAMRSCEQSVSVYVHKKNSHFREWQRLWTEPMCPAKATIYIDPTIVWPPVTHRIPVQMTSEYFHFAHRSTAEFFRRSCKWFNEKWVKMTSKFNGTQLRFNEKKKFGVIDRFSTKDQKLSEPFISVQILQSMEMSERICR